jgi:hypothetical protein
MTPTLGLPESKIPNTLIFVLQDWRCDTVDTRARIETSF